MRPIESVRALALVVLLVIFATASVAASDYRSHLSSDPAVNQARALIEGGRYGEALQVLRPLAPGHPDRTDVLFLVGLAALGAAQVPEIAEPERTVYLDEAVAAFRAILIDRPGLVRVRLELARSFFLKGDDDLSREHFERVLAGRPSPAMAANIQRFLGAIRARRRWTGHFGATLAPDSNINAASDEKVIYIRGLPFHRDAAGTARSGLGAVLWGGGEYQHPLGKRLRLRTGADLARREYAGSEFDQTFLSAHVGPRWLVGQATEISLLGSARRRWTGGEPYSHELGTRLEAIHRFSRQFAAHGRASWHRREYEQDASLNGPHTAISVGGILQATPTVRVDAVVGSTHERPRSPLWRNSGRWVRLGASVDLPRGFTVSVSGELLWTRYKGSWAPFTPDGSARRDRTRVLRASVFNRGFTVFGFGPKLVLVNEIRTSNAQLYDYRRNRAELQFVRQF